MEAGRIKVYSRDSVAGRAMLVGEGTPEHRMWVLNQFQQFLYHELVPVIRGDCHSESIGIASGEGEAEDIGESWRVAKLLGEKAVPNRVDSWARLAP